MRYHLHTYGCQMNCRDSEAVAAHLEAHGFECARGEAEADLVVVNTCSVRAKAEEKAIGKIGLLCATKRERPDRIVGVMGCMAQRRGHSLLRQFPKLDFVVGPSQWSEIPSIIHKLVRGGGPTTGLALAGSASDRTARVLHLHRAPGVCAFMTILLGCNRRCAYCIVPAVRGREYSRPAVDILAEARQQVEAGVREITLLGQNVLNYGRCGTDPWTGETTSPLYHEAFPRLLAALNELPGLARIRFTSGHPSGGSAELIEAMRSLPAVCPHLHLPLQSGSNRILKRMHRGYTREQYLDRIRQFKTALPDLAVSTDIIVGFPGETETDFEQTRAVMDAIGFSQAYIFKYSPRPGTPAAALKDDVSETEKMRRNRQLLDDQNQVALRRNRRRIGRRVPVLVEGPSPRNAENWTGRAPDNTVVLFPPPDGGGPGTVHEIDIRRVTAQALYGQPAAHDTVSSAFQT